MSGRYVAWGPVVEGLLTALGNHVYPGYLWHGSEKNVLIEAGFSRIGPAYINQIEELPGGLERNAPEMLMVTHGHYDHLGAVSYLRRQLRSLDFAAAPGVGELLAKDKVRRTMNFLSTALGDYFPELKTGSDFEPKDLEIGPETVDLPLKEGDRIALGDCGIEVYETPGHTRDHLSFFIREHGILFPGEALGNPIIETPDEVKVEFLSSYNDYLASLEKLLELIPRVKIMAMSHLFFYRGSAVQDFARRSRQATLDYRCLIEEYLDQAHGDCEAAAAEMLRVEYDEKGNIYQERNAYYVNLKAQVKAVMNSA